jgi:hypothetical protein
MSKQLFDRVIHNVEVAQNATAYTSIVEATGSTGEVALEIVSSAGSITVTQQCSPDKNTWYDPEDGSGNALGAVVAAMTVGAKYVVPSAVVARFLRYKIVEGNTAASTVKIRFIMQEDS